jgi:phosphinothricin acetyltransferase
VYVAPDAKRMGVGRALLSAIIDDCTARGFRQMIAGVSGGDASVALHEALGFRVVARFPAVGFKFGRWVDVIMLQRALGDGDTTLL